MKRNKERRQTKMMERNKGKEKATEDQRGTER
jgi:hypothetical protein